MRVLRLDEFEFSRSAGFVDVFSFVDEFAGSGKDDASGGSVGFGAPDGEVGGGFDGRPRLTLDARVASVLMLAGLLRAHV